MDILNQQIAAVRQERAELDGRLTEHCARMERLRSDVRQKREEYERAMGEYDREWMTGESIRTRLRYLDNTSHAPRDV